jgi:hypothetical protein
LSGAGFLFAKQLALLCVIILKAGMKAVLWMLLFGLTIAVQAQKQAGWQSVDDRMRALHQREVRSIDQLSRYINSNFTSDGDKLRAIYFWLGTSIDYDMASLNRPQKQQSRNEVISTTFSRRKGVCEGYAGLMDTLCKLSGIPVHTVHGFTKQQLRIDPLPHAWIAAKAGNDWFLFDPTFASGSLINGKFVREFDERWFMVSPYRMIETHMPYDHIWQFLSSPVSYRNFAQGNKDSNLYDRPIHYQDSIANHRRLPTRERLISEQSRIQMNDFSHPVIKLRLDYINEALKVNEYNNHIELFNSATKAFNDAAAAYNTYARARNHHGLDDRSAAQLSNQLVDAMAQLNRATDLLRQISKPPTKLAQHIRNLNQNIDQLRAQVSSEMRAIGRSK